MAVTTCICLKYGTAYGPEYVNRLYAGLRRNSRSDLRLLCMTEDRTGIRAEVEILPLPVEPFAEKMEAALRTAPKRGRLKKISLFRPDLVPDLTGPLMVFDLDLVVLGDIDEMRDYAPGKIVMRREWTKSAEIPSPGHGSVEKIEPQRHAYLYEAMAQDPAAAVAFGYGSEQSYTSLMAEKRGDLEFYPDDWVASFKRDCRPPRPLNLVLEPRRPPLAKIVCFHGRPKMEEAVAGYRAGPLHSTRPCHWLRKVWSEE